MHASNVRFLFVYKYIFDSIWTCFNETRSLPAIDSLCRLKGSGYSTNQIHVWVNVYEKGTCKPYTSHNKPLKSTTTADEWKRMCSQAHFQEINKRSHFQCFILFYHTQNNWFDGKVHIVVGPVDAVQYIMMNHIIAL